MPYTKSVWVAGVTVIDAARQNNLETQYDEALLDSAKASGGVFLQRIGARYSLPGWAQAIPSNNPAAPTAHSIHFTPILLRQAITFDRICCEVTFAGGAGDLGRLGIYNSDLAVDGLTPDTLLLDAGTFTADAVAAKEIVIAQALGPGWYFLAFVTESGTFQIYLHEVASAGTVSPLSGTNTILASPGVRKVLTTAANPGANWPVNGLPDPAPACTAFSTNEAVILRDSS